MAFKNSKGKGISAAFPLPKKKDFLFVNLGLIFTALGIVVFKTPNHFAMGGTSGISILLNALVPSLDVGVVLFIINALLVLLGYLVLGKSFGGSTVFASAALSFYVWIFETLLKIKAPLTNDTMLEMVWAVLLPAIGSALVFNAGSSTGGTDIVALILNQKTSVEVGKALLLSDIAITMGAGAIFGVKTFLYCVLGTIMKSFLVDSLIEGFNIRKKLNIVSRNPEPIKEFILHDLKRSATIYTAYGAFTHEPLEVIETILSRRQAMLLRNFIRKTDPQAFMSILNSSETIGKGFRDI